jgi:hypothetical protein
MIKGNKEKGVTDGRKALMIGDDEFSDFLFWGQVEMLVVFQLGIVN